MLDEEQKKKFKIRVELLGFDMDFFKEIYLLGFGVSLFGVANDWKISKNLINKIEIEEIEKLINPINEDFNYKTNEEKINIVMDLIAQGAEIENNILIPPPPLSLKKPSNKKNKV